MESILGKLFIDLQERITNNCPSVRWVDQDFGQIDFREERPQVSFPCVLFDLEDTTYDNGSNLAQIGQQLLVVRLAFTPYSNSNHLTPIAFREKAIRYFDIEQEIYVALQGWATDYCGAFIRVKASTEKREDDMRVRRLEFTTSFEDYSATNIPTYPLPPPQIN